MNDAEKDKLLRRAAALLVPVQWDEPFGMVFAEALACGTPVISTARGAVSEIVQHGINGFLIGSISEGADAVAKISSIDRALCRRDAERRFSVAAAVDRYTSIYASLVHPKHP